MLCLCRQVRSNAEGWLLQHRRHLPVLPLASSRQLGWHPFRCVIKPGMQLMLAHAASLAATLTMHRSVWLQGAGKVLVTPTGELPG